MSNKLDDEDITLGDFDGSIDSELDFDLTDEAIEKDDGTFGQEDESGIDFELIDDGLILDEDGESSLLEDDDTVEADSLLEEDKVDPYAQTHGNIGYISTTGDIVAMGKDDDNTAFSLKYINIKDIAVTKRIRDSISVDDLTRSIKSTGLLEPIVVMPTLTDGKYALLAGYRRLISCASIGKQNIPCVVNSKVTTKEIPIVEAMYNHSKNYTMKEIISYIDYLEKVQRITNPNLIEFIVQINNGDYSKLKDIISDGDEEIYPKLLDGQYSIGEAFRKLEQRRKKESAEEKANKRSAAVYGDENSGIDIVAGAGENETDGSELTPEQLSELQFNASDIDNGLDDVSLTDMIEEGKNIKGFEAHKQKVGEREFVDPIVKKSTLARDNFTCVCCREGGQSYIDVLDFHHVVPVFLGGEDSVDNGATLCVKCHRQVHLYSTGDMTIPAEKTEDEVIKLTNEELIIYKAEQAKFKRIVKLGLQIRKGMAAKGINREQYKKEHPNTGIGRYKPGESQDRT